MGNDQVFKQKYIKKKLGVLQRVYITQKKNLRKIHGLNKPNNEFWEVKFQKKKRFSKIDFLVYLNQIFLKICF